MKLNSFKLTQKGGRGIIDIYITTFRAGDIVHKINIDRWTENNYGGYQRFPSESRLRMTRGSALRYLVKELGCFPSSVLLNVRGNVEFIPENRFGWYEYGQLNVGDNDFWLIDGQHRIEALKRAIDRNSDFEDYPIITSVLRLPDRFDEMMLFYIVNRRQRGVATDLVHRHLQRMLWQKGEEWVLDLEGRKGLMKSYAIEIVDFLNSETVSPWFGRIRLVGQPKHIDHLLTDREMTSTVVEILREKMFINMPIRDIAWRLIDFWNALYRIYPDCFTDPSGFSLLRRPGMNAMHKLFPEIYSESQRVNEADEETMYLLLSRLLKETSKHSVSEFRSPITSDFWSYEHGSVYALSTTRLNVTELYEGITEKIWLSSN